MYACEFNNIRIETLPTELQNFIHEQGNKSDDIVRVGSSLKALSEIVGMEFTINEKSGLVCLTII